MKKNVLSKDEIMTLFEPQLRAKGILYKKYKQVLAKRATFEEEIVTRTADGRETKNIVKAGDYIVMNQTEAKELYKVSKDKFIDRYDFVEKAHDGFDLYNPKGSIIGLELTAPVMEKLHLPNPFFFVAPWGEISEARKRDFMVALQDYSQVYRITRKEFVETYNSVDNPLKRLR